MARCKIINLWFTRNYGAILTCYALQKALTALGNEVQVVNYMNSMWRKLYTGTFSEHFAGSHLNLTKPFQSEEDLVSLNNDTDVFIVGSDQVFRHKFYAMHGYIPYLLAFASADKRKLACSASFGCTEYDGSPIEACMFKYNLQQFDGVSVREDSGVDILKRMGIKSTQIVDPVFYLSSEEWNCLADENHTPVKKGILYFSLSYADHAENPPVLFYLKKHLSKEINIQQFDYSRSVPEWLDSIRQADFVVTDSFHGTCFSILLHKPFVVLAAYPEMRTRMDQILKTLGLTEHIITPDTDSGLDCLLKPIDWNAVDRILEEERNRALDWLKQHLDAPVKEKPADSIILNMLWRRSQQAETIKNTAVLSNKLRITLKYIKYKLFCNIMPKKKSERYHEKMIKYKEYMDIINRYEKKML